MIESYALWQKDEIEYGKTLYYSLIYTLVFLSIRPQSRQLSF